MKLIPILFSLFSLVAFADTPPPNTVKAKMYTGDGNTAITATSSSLNVNVSNSTALTTVNQGNSGSQSWLSQVTSSVLPTNACKESGGNLETIVSELASPLAVTGTFWQTTQPVSGTVTTTNTANGTPGASAPSDATQVGGADGSGNLSVFKVSNTGVLSVDGSASTQPVSGTFWQDTQPISGTVTANAGTGTFTVDASGNTVPVSGTFWQDTQPVSVAGTVTVTGTVTATNTANGSPDSPAPSQATQIAGNDYAGDIQVVKVSSAGLVSVDGSGAVQPVSADSLPLPSGAATSDLQSTINTTLGSPFQAGGSIGNSSFGISGSLPAYAATPTFNLGTLNGAATAANQSTLITNLGSPFQAGGSIGNSSFGISGTLPDYASTPTFNLGTLNGAATASNQTTANTSLASIATNTGNIPAQGQALAAASMPVVLTASQLSTLTPLTTITVNQGTQGVGAWPVLAAQSGTWNVTNVSGTVSLPTGASTDSSVTGLQVSQGSTTSGQKGGLSLGAVTTGAPTYTTAQTSPFSLTTAGALRVDGSATTQPVSGTFWQATQPVSIATAPALVASSAIIGKVGIDQTTPGTTNGVQVNAALPAGTNVIGHVIVDTAPTTAVSQSGTWTVNSKATTPTALTVKQAALSIGTSAARLTNDGSAPASTRVLLVAQLLSTSTANCFFGSSGVTTTSTTRGVQMFAGQTISFSNDAGDYYAICDATSQTVLVTEQE